MSTITSPEVLAQATEWLREYVARDRLAVAITVETEMIDVTQGMLRSQIPGQTTWYVEYVNSMVPRIGKPTTKGRIEVPGDMVDEWVRGASPEMFNCMWCGQEFQTEAVRDYHEEGCG